MFLVVVEIDQTKKITREKGRRKTSSDSHDDVIKVFVNLSDVKVSPE